MFFGVILLDWREYFSLSRNTQKESWFGSGYLLLMQCWVSLLGMFYVLRDAERIPPPDPWSGVTTPKKSWLGCQYLLLL
jgi:hypothetical protein